MAVIEALEAIGWARDRAAAVARSLAVARDDRAPRSRREHDGDRTGSRRRLEELARYAAVDAQGE
jgi:hypothetical protein